MRYFFYVLFIIFIACPSSAADTAQSFDELTSRYEVGSCIGCHDVNGQQWSASLHAQSITEPRILKTFNMYIADKSVSLQTSGKPVLKECLSCHAPQTADASADLLRSISDLIAAAAGSPDEEKRKSAFEVLSNLDVNCRVCHMIKGMPRDEVQLNTIYGPGWDEDEISHKRHYGYETIRSEYLTSSRICISCHRDGETESASSPYLEFHAHILDHYKEYRSGKTCQQCHMQTDGMTTHTFSHE